MRVLFDEIQQLQPCQKGGVLDIGDVQRELKGALKPLIVDDGQAQWGLSEEVLLWVEAHVQLCRIGVVGGGGWGRDGHRSQAIQCV